MNCRKCNKTDCEFYASNKYVCKDCVKQQSAIWKKENLLRKNATRLEYDWSKRGIVDVDKANFIRNTIKSCAICDSTSNLQVDHCHETGTVRSMLCGRCNRALGGFGDNPELLMKAATYVQNYKPARIQNEDRDNRHAFKKAA